MSNYAALTARLAHGWNTWSTESVLSHVLLPQRFALNLGLFSHGEWRNYPQERPAFPSQRTRLGVRSWDGSYTELEVIAHGVTCRVQTATVDGDLLILVTPTSVSMGRSPCLVADAGMLWNRPGHVQRLQDSFQVAVNGGELAVWWDGDEASLPHRDNVGPSLALVLDRPVCISTGRRRSLVDVQGRIAASRSELLTSQARWGSERELGEAMQTALAWDTIYDPSGQRVISPVSRTWNVQWGGYVLFDWDTFFAAYMLSFDHRDLAYANVFAIVNAATPQGFIPNFSAAAGRSSLDRSQPPVGSFVVREIHRRHGDMWLLAEVFPALLRWNRWWPEHRANGELLSWGSTPYCDPWSGELLDGIDSINTLQAAKWESGLDNSPMYDDVPYDRSRHVMELHDVGLNSLYAWDCACLADIAKILGRPEEAELRARAEQFRRAIQTLWDEDTGMFLNRRSDTGAFSPRTSPTNFYPLLAGAATPAQAARMVNEHLLNPAEFWGEHVIPSISRRDPAYIDQDYWRGRIWAPMNFLVYLGLANYDLPEARRQLVAKSRTLLLREWREHRHVHENYSAVSGLGCDKANSDAFYHWGALLGVVGLLEDAAGRIEGDPRSPA